MENLDNFKIKDDKDNTVSISDAIKEYFYGKENTPTVAGGLDITDHGNGLYTVTSKRTETSRGTVITMNRSALELLNKTITEEIKSDIK